MVNANKLVYLLTRCAVQVCLIRYITVAAAYFECKWILLFYVLVLLLGLYDGPASRDDEKKQ